MEALVFVAIVAAVAVIGLGIGLAMAPRLAQWDERRSRTADDHPGDGEGDEDRG